MKILVTGHSGLIGSHLVDLLIKQGNEVYGISSSRRNENPLCSNLVLDLKQTIETASMIESIKPEIVFHLAANAAEGKSLFSPIDITTNGVNTFYNVLVPSIRAGNLKRFIFVSSAAVYGAIHTPYREVDQPQPQDLYGIGKLACENALRIMSKVHNFEQVIVRPHNVTGPHQNMSDPYRNVITIFMNQLLKGQPYAIYGDGEMRRCFSYVKDVVKVIAQCGFEDVAGLLFNVGSDKDYSINDLSEMIQKISGITIPPLYLPDRTMEVHTAIVDHTLTKRVFGYNETSFEQAIKETWAWCKEQGAQEYKHTTLELESPKIPENWKK